MHTPAPPRNGRACPPRGARVGIRQKPAPRIGVQQQVKTKPDMAWYKAECGLFSCDYCFWCKLEKGQWGLTDISEPGKPRKLGFRRGKNWTTDDRFLHAHCLIPEGGNTYVQP